jgi:gamma-glutamyltranspeptidase / glutathione hydrolase
MTKKTQPLGWRALSPLALALAVAGCGGGGGGQDNAALIAAIAAINAANPPAPPPPAADKGCLIGDSGTPVTVGSGDPGDPAAPEPASGYVVGHKLVYAKNYMVVANHPLATRAGCDILKAGGSAVDAAVAVQVVLGLVEPQSSGLGGGAFMLHYDAKTKKVQAYDGREMAPAAATENYLRYIDDVSDKNPPQPTSRLRASGRSIGTPGAVRMLDIAYKDHGKLPWKDLFGYGITLASDGFPIGGRMATAISGAATDIKRDADATAYFFNEDGTPKALGTRLRNPAYAKTLTTLATQGADAFYTGAIAQGIVDKIAVSKAVDGSAITPGKTTMADMANYVAKRRDPVCGTYRDYYICSMSPPSSGGIAVVQALGILENFNMGQYKPTAIDLEGGKPSVMGVHLVSEAERLAYADRDKYVADTDFVPLPGGSPDKMLRKSYLQERAGLISLTRSMGLADPGKLDSVPRGIDKTEERGTTHFTVVDKQGNVVTMTTTVEASMGSFHMTQGFLLNNQLTDFSADPNDAKDPSIKIANRVEPGKRPRSTMAPTLVFKKNADGSMGEFVMGTGSPGGGTIIQYVVKTLVGALDWGLDAQQATSLVDFGATNSKAKSEDTFSPTNVGGEHPAIDTSNSGNNDPLITGLRALGHTVNFGAQSSGISTIIRTNVGGQPVLTGGADPRREGIVLGDTFTP